MAVERTKKCKNGNVNIKNKNHAHCTLTINRGRTNARKRRRTTRDCRGPWRRRHRRTVGGWWLAGAGYTTTTTTPHSTTATATRNDLPRPVPLWTAFEPSDGDQPKPSVTIIFFRSPDALCLACSGRAVTGRNNTVFIGKILCALSNVYLHRSQMKRISF